MEPFPLRTARLVLDQPDGADVDTIARYCSDPVFERFMTTPWPYTRQDAVGFVEQFVPTGWATNTEWTWAVRDADGDGALLGVAGVTVGTGMVGYWLGSPHRGRGVMPEALAAVIDAVFARTGLTTVRWECVVGNRASARVAEKTGFRFTGRGPGLIPMRDGSPSDSWTGELGRDEDRAPKPGWSAPRSPHDR